MKKSKKIFLRVLPVLIIAVMMFTFTFSFNFVSAAKNNKNATEPISNDLSSMVGGSGSTTLNDTAKNIWSSVTLILQILAVAAIVFAGVRYMFASADAKADIKKQMVILIIGAVMVFAASTIINVIVNVTKEIA